MSKEDRAGIVQHKVRRDESPAPKVRRVLPSHLGSEPEAAMAPEPKRRTVSAQPTEQPRQILAPSPKAWLKPANRLDKAAKRRLQNLKPASWQGDCPLPSLPWRFPFAGPILVVSLFDGIGALIVALLALGAQIFVIASESEEDLVSAVAKCFHSVAHVGTVQSLTEDHFEEFFEHHEVGAVLVGGGSPCQGNSLLNTNRAGMKDPRTLLYQYVAKVATMVKNVLARRQLDIPVAKFLENVKYCPAEFVAAVNADFAGPPIAMEASDQGYHKRARLFWGDVNGTAVTTTQLDLPRDVTLQQEIVQGRSAQDRPYAEKIQLRAAYYGHPMPKKIVTPKDYFLNFDTKEVQAGNSKGFGTFSREFVHPTDRVKSASKAAGYRFYAGDKLFPPMAYEEEALLWTAGPHDKLQWMVPTPYVRAQAMGIPRDLIDALPDNTETEKGSKDAIRNSALGNSFHVPSVALFMVFLFQLVAATAGSVQVPIYVGHELFMREACKGTCWEPGVMESYPGLLSGSQVADAFISLCASEGLHISNLTKLRAALAIPAVACLQAYWVDTQLRGLEPNSQGPQWAQQKQQAAQAAALGTQRGAILSRHAAAELVEPGLSKEEHMAAALSLASPFQVDPVVDDDAKFACRASVIFGPFVRTWRRRQDRACKKLMQALAPWDEELREQMTDGVASVARAKCPATMVVSAILLRWPDVIMGCRYVTGYHDIGEVEDSHLFRPIPVDPDQQVGKEFLLSDDHKPVRDGMRFRVRSGEHDEEMRAMCLEEVAEGYALGPFNEAELDEKFGQNGWCALERFMHVQGCGKKRCIDSGKAPGHNRFSRACETIFTTSIDFIPACILYMVSHFFAVLVDMGQVDMEYLQQATREQLLQLLPPWLAFLIGTEDMKMAYRQVPVHPSDYCCNVVAYFDEEFGMIMFIILLGHPFGLHSAVNNFNRTLLGHCALIYIFSFRDYCWAITVNLLIHCGKSLLVPPN